MTEPASLNLFDLAVLIVIGLSALLSFYRGFIREILSLSAWVIASLVTLHFMPIASASIQPQIKSAAIANGIASVGLFFVTLIVVSIATSLLLKILKPAAKIGLFDNLAGLCFGVARGVLIVSIGYFAITIVMVEKNYPDWIKHAVSRPYIAQSAKLIGKAAPDYLSKIFSTDKKTSDEDTTHDTGKETTQELIHKLEKARANAADSIDDASHDAKEDAASLPSIEDLQQRIREENEKK